MGTFTDHHRNRTGRRAVLAGLLGLAATAALAAVSDLRSEAEAADRPAPAVTPGAEDAPDATPDAGEFFGRIAGAYVAPDELALDEMELIAGDTEDGAYALRDVPGRNRTFAVAGDVIVTRVDCERGGCAEGVRGEYGDLTRDVADRPSGNAFRVTVRDGHVVRIDEVYLA